MFLQQLEKASWCNVSLLVCLPTIAARKKVVPLNIKHQPENMILRSALWFTVLILTTIGKDFNVLISQQFHNVMIDSSEKQNNIYYQLGFEHAIERHSETY